MILTSIYNLSSDITERASAASDDEIQAMLDEIKAVLPKEKLKNLFTKKMKDETDFSNLVGLIKSDNFTELLANFLNAPALSKEIAEIRSLGITLNLVELNLPAFIGLA